MHSGRTNQPLLVQYEFVEIKCLIQLRRQSTFTAVSTPRPTYLRTGLCCVGPCETIPSLISPEPLFDPRRGVLWPLGGNSA